MTKALFHPLKGRIWTHHSDINAGPGFKVQHIFSLTEHMSHKLPSSCFYRLRPLVFVVQVRRGSCILTCAVTPEELLLLFKTFKSVNYTITTNTQPGCRPETVHYTQIQQELHFRLKVLIQRGARQHTLSDCWLIHHFGQTEISQQLLEGFLTVLSHLRVQIKATC